MKKILIIIIAFTLFSCNEKEVLLPEVDTTIVDKVENLSPIYIFFEAKGKDTIADLNRKNAISSTNFIFNIDKRLPLKLVLPEVIKAVAKKEASAHKDSTSQNYYSYSNIKKKQLAFVPFTKMNYKLEKPKSGRTIYFSKNQIFVDNVSFEKEKFENYIENLSVEDLYKCNFCFDKNDSYENYIKNLVFIKSLDIKRTHTEENIY
ncbi:hypothetical protein [Flavobacterium aquatile]|uniref:Lipoprotein n=1 Tax=Flavobacterium aquatile LMG 4008 = ATCC 11947 TaxID=1453498 RepID=A0A095SW01_9FLAO|nr:hypothetical protein [Flavobacterium aquatile]KGD68539.1 hypothetical protein LG45_09705 [Flavobacterium aquatile LMG 4008 = ATCC 11947]OXA68531.1 hypothetical protein B0A61_02135 [Flavobacterium aquatile LMG 4008 = ATCC 11947]GEC79409.1 hypothetical protein FAQ01_22790 [Flavobacterium aquatile]